MPAALEIKASDIVAEVTLQLNIPGDNSSKTPEEFTQDLATDTEDAGIVDSLQWNKGDKDVHR